MQYILTQEEMDDINKKLNSIERLPSVKELQKFCTMVANEIPVKSGWMKGKVWQCILTVKKDYEWYCDECPAKKICPYEYKEWSK